MAVGAIPNSQLSTVRKGVALYITAANAFRALQEAAKKQLKRNIDVALPAGGYRSASVQNAMHAAGAGHDRAAKLRWGLNPSSVVAIAVHPYGTHEPGTRVDIVGTPMDSAFLKLAAKYGFTREFGSRDPNHFKHDGKTAIKAQTKVVKTMTSIEGVDYAYDRPTASELKIADKKFVVRYVTVPGKANKGISQAEYDSLKKAGIEVVAVYEGAAGDMKKGKNQGVADAKVAQANLKAIVGLNDNLPVYFACDFDATPADQTAINAYLDGAASVIGRDRVGIYGGYYPVKRAHDAKKATWLWQTYAWSGGKVLDGIHLYQYRNGVKLGSGTVDLCRALQTTYGQKGITPKPVEAPKPAVTAPKPAPVTIVDPTPAQEPAKVTTNGPAELSFELSSTIVSPIYFKADNGPEIYVFLPLSGTKRHITPSEWTLAKAAGIDTVHTVSQATAQQIPNAS